MSSIDYWDPGYGLAGYVVPPVEYTVADYIQLLPSAHTDKQNFVTALSTALSGFVDCLNTIYDFSDNFDLDEAVGPQLDATGVRIGLSRNVVVPINAYFAFDTAGLGFDQGVWYVPGDATTGITVLPDESYRNLLRAKIAANTWDGTTVGLPNIVALIFAGITTSITVTDNFDMSISIAVTGHNLPAVELALLTGGLLLPKPTGVKMIYTITNT